MQAVVDMCRQNVTCEKKGGPFFLPQTPVSQGLAALRKGSLSYISFQSDYNIL